MVGKKSGKALLREEGLERTDNGMKQSNWPEVAMINQKNYYTDFLKRDDQILPHRLQNEANRDKMIRVAKDRDRALARTGNTEVPLPGTEEAGPEDDESREDDGLDPSKIIVVHFGSQNMRIGLASDALPKTITMARARQYSQTESEEYEARPRRKESDSDVEYAPEQQFGEEFSKKYTKMSNELKVDMRANKRKVLPNSKELVINYNRRTPPETIPEHNDSFRIEWTDTSSKDKSAMYIGLEAQRIPDEQDPKYKLFWPIQHGVFHENDYGNRQALFDDLSQMLEHGIRSLGIDHIQWVDYSIVFVIPDLYDKKYVEQALYMCLVDFECKQVSFVQESLAATFGAGYTTSCVVDIGAQKTSIACVEDGMVIEESRINLKFGGYDVTETFLKMMLYDHFPYQEINLKRRYDFLLAEELKINFCTLNQADISVQLFNFHLRAPNQPTRKYQFKTYDEVILAPMGFYDPSVFDNSEKLDGRRSHIDRSYNAYDPDMPDDPTSTAQLAILTSIKPSLATITATPAVNGNAEMSTPSKEKPNPFNLLPRPDTEMNGNSQVTSAAGSPAPEGSNTPLNAASFVFGGNNGINGNSPGGAANFNFGVGNGTQNFNGVNGFPNPFTKTATDIAIERESVVPVAPLDTAIITSIQHAAKTEDKKTRDLFSSIMVIGGAANTPGFGSFLEERLKTRRPDLADKILVGTSPREMDGQVVVWKGASVFGRMQSHESWMRPLEFERLGARVLHHKVLWNY